MNAAEARELSAANQAEVPIPEIMRDIHRMVEEAASAGQWQIVNPIERIAHRPTSRQWENVIGALEAEGYRYIRQAGQNWESDLVLLRWCDPCKP